MLIHALASLIAITQFFAPTQSPHVAAQSLLGAPHALHTTSQVPVQVLGFAPVAQAPGQARHQGGWLGISFAGSKADGSDDALSVITVVGGSPAEHAGIRSKDRVVSLNGRAVASYADVVAQLQQLSPGTEINVQVRREISVQLDSDHKSSQGAFVLGVMLGSQHNIGDDDGVEVSSVVEGSPAQASGIQRGDVLLNVEGKRVASSGHVSNVLKSIDEEREVQVELARTLEVKLGTSRQDLAPQGAQPRQDFAPQVTSPRMGRPGGAPPAVAPSKPRSPSARAVPPPAAPRARTPSPEDTDALLDEVRALSNELRDLREQIAALRGQLDQLRTRR